MTTHTLLVSAASGNSLPYMRLAYASRRSRRFRFVGEVSFMDRSPNRFWSIDPILRPSMAVCECKNPDDRLADDIRNVGGKQLEVHSAIAAGSHARHLVVSLDPGNVPLNLFPESPA